jgi:DNA invertase Pin-like site-specific DNA recombinase
MNTKTKRTVRCAIYTRVSTEQGLDQDFNSLDAQSDASQAYVRSQAHAGWLPIRTKYDDGGFSGGNTERPALQRLLADVRGGKVDVIVVYKVDRLTRSLADFAKLVELFDRHNVSFVSVTQHFNTTTSMGRLTLNVLLSFAQFEREVTSERIRDKIAASKRKGLWVGGNLPLGYALKERKPVIVAKEAELVRTIFRTYLKLGSTTRLAAELRARGINTKVRTLTDGRKIGGRPFMRGPLTYLLRNRFYVGEVYYKDEILAGAQPALLPRSLFNAVQTKLAEQLNNYKKIRGTSAAPLTGKIFDDQGILMGPSHTRKKARKYRYYISSCLAEGRKDCAGSISRVPAPAVENAIAAKLRASLGRDAEMNDNDLLRNRVVRVEVRKNELVVLVSRRDSPKSLSKIRIAWNKPSHKRQREILLPSALVDQAAAKPIRSDVRVRLTKAIAQGRLWVRELKSGAVKDVAEIARRENCSVRSVNKTLSLAFLAPGLVKAAIDGSLPRGIGYARLCDLPVEWSRQYASLGLRALH